MKGRHSYHEVHGIGVVKSFCDLIEAALGSHQVDKSGTNERLSARECRRTSESIELALLHPNNEQTVGRRMNLGQGGDIAHGHSEI